MKNKNLLLLCGLTLLLASIFSSCNTTNKTTSLSFIEKRKYNKGFYIGSVLSKTKKRGVNKNLDINKREPLQVIPIHTIDIPDLLASVEKAPAAPIVHLNFQRSPENEKLILSTPGQPEECDEIIFKNGDEVKAKVIEVSKENVKYKRCDNPDGPIYNIPISDIFMIKYKDGSKEVFSKKSANEDINRNETTERTTEGFSIAGFVVSLVGIFLFILGLPALIFSLIGISKISNNPEKWKGKGFAIAGAIIGAIELFLFIIVMASMGFI